MNVSSELVIFIQFRVISIKRRDAERSGNVLKHFPRINIAGLVDEGQEALVAYLCGVYPVGLRSYNGVVSPFFGMGVVAHKTD